MSQHQKNRVILVVMDGWGEAAPGPHNAVHLAQTPELDRLTDSHPSTVITAHGRAVGLPANQMGNSEVGHLNLGAGRIVKQDLVLIDEAIETGEFSQNPVFLEAIAKIREKGGRAHIMGLCSPGGVHSSLEHLYALVDLIYENGLEIWLHAITDGRDTPPRSARAYLREIEERIKGRARIATVVGRFYSMDRDTRWERVETGYAAHTAGIGTRHPSVDEAIGAAYESGEGDEFISPRIIAAQGERFDGSISQGDGVFFFNFRADRAREMTRALTEVDFQGFERKCLPELSSYVCMTQYQSDFNLPVAFPPVSMTNILGQILSERGLRQFRVAETEKYAHVTFFFNGGVEKPFDGEERLLIPSPTDVPTYDLKPTMSAREVGDATVKRIEMGKDDFILVNFANGDMVGHTGFLDAAVKAVETVDREVGRIVDAARKTGASVMITADHGNCEKMFDEETGEPYTAHTTNPVPLIFFAAEGGIYGLREGGSLRDVAPTVLELLGQEVPREMTGKSLLEKKSG